MEKIQALRKLKQLTSDAERLLSYSSDSQEFTLWHRNTSVAIEKIFGKGTRHATDFSSISYHLWVVSSETTDYEFQKAHRGGLQTAIQTLKSMYQEVEEYWSDAVVEAAPPVDALRTIETLCSRFHLVVRQLGKRHDNRATIEIEDEYDVQDLFSALLNLQFDDIRAEEWSPSYAGGSSRVDFLLKQNSIVVEIKKTRSRLGAREIGNELLIDIGRYQSHPSCRNLLCFVYDPDSRIANPRGLEMDLSKKFNELEVKVFVRPMGT